MKPISVNKCWQGKRFKTYDYKAWRQEFGWEIKGDVKTVEGLVEVTLNYYIKAYMTTDVDNMAKATLDGLVENGAIQDDRFIIGLHQWKFRESDKNKQRIEIIIEPYKE